MPLPSPIALIGYRGTGKTTIAQLLAARLEYDWVDADIEVEILARQSIAEIFDQSGEKAFRDLEAEVVAKLCQREQVVVALGGGAILREENRKCLARCSPIVWLKASPETIAKRLQGDPTTSTRRPNLTNHGGRNEIDDLLRHRAPIYRTCATLEVDTEEKTPVEIADEIFEAIGL